MRRDSPYRYEQVKERADLLQGVYFAYTTKTKRKRGAEMRYDSPYRYEQVKERADLLQGVYFAYTTKTKRKRGAEMRRICTG